MSQLTHYRGRFAPSPTGPLHLGSLLAAFGSWLMARHAQGEWWIRIEDLDPPREVPGAADAQLRTLAGFGLVSDGPVVRQSARHALYRDALDRLLAADRAFACTCNRSDLAAVDGIHRVCVRNAGRGKAARSAAAIRLRVADNAVVGFEDTLHGFVSQHVATSVGDVVLQRADGFWAYQLAVVVDGDDPLPALRLAWCALGQRPGMLDGLGSVARLLSGASAEFDPSVIPHAPQVFAALHNGAAAADA